MPRGLRFKDILAPKGDTFQVRLKRKGEAVAGLYKEDQKDEIRSPSLDEVQSDPKSPHDG